jgi:hypothetical protein
MQIATIGSAVGPIHWIDDRGEEVFPYDGIIPIAVLVRQ